MNDNKNNEPIVLGQLKKEKSSKPVFVLIVFIFLLGVCFGLPEINAYLVNEDNAIAAFYNKYIGGLFNSGVKNNNFTATTTKNNNIDNGLVLLNKNARLELDKITIYNISLNKNVLSFDIKGSSYLNLDLNKYFIEIYNSEKKMLGRIKLVGVIGQEKVSTSGTANFGLNSDQYYLKLVLLKVDDYPEVSLNENTLTCKNSENTYTYKYIENGLLMINHEYIFDDISDLNVYTNNLTNSNLKSSFINGFENCSSLTEETDAGFKFVAILDMSKVKLNDLKQYIDYNYYELGTSLKVINYEMITKGFDCV